MKGRGITYWLADADGAGSGVYSKNVTNLSDNSAPPWLPVVYHRLPSNMRYYVCACLERTLAEHRLLIHDESDQVRVLLRDGDLKLARAASGAE